jgi:hypothetical protein
MTNLEREAMGKECQIRAPQCQPIAMTRLFTKISAEINTPK